MVVERLLFWTRLDLEPTRMGANAVQIDSA
jgi:hypothetical protein